MLHATGSVSSKPLTFWIGGQTLLAESLHWIRQINALPGTISDDIWRGSTAARNEAPRALCAQVLVLRNLRVCKASAAAYCKDAAVAYEHIVDPVEGGSSLANATWKNKSVLSFKFRRAYLRVLHCVQVRTTCTNSRRSCRLFQELCSSCKTPLAGRPRYFCSILPEQLQASLKSYSEVCKSNMQRSMDIPVIL